MLGIVSGAEDAVTTGELSISGANIEFGDTVYLYFAVDYSAVGLSDDITLKVTNNATGETKVLVRNESVEETKGFPASSIGFKLDNLGAKNMGDELTIQAFKGDKESGKAKTFSVLEYAIKARVLGNEKLTNLVNAMIAYGAKAQAAFEHTDKENQYDLKKNYGLVVVGGSNEGKVIAEIGTKANVTPKTEKTGDNAKLYTTALEAIEGDVILPDGVAYYVYIGDKQRTVGNLDMTQANEGCAGSVENLGAGGTDTKYKIIYTTATSNGLSTAPSGTKGKAYAQYNVAAGDNTAGTSRVDVTTGENGYIKLHCANKESSTFQMSGSAAFIKDLDEFTMSITIGKDGTADMFTGVYRIRGGGTNDQKALVFLNVTNSDGNSVLKMREDTLATIQGEAGKSKFVTLHFVVNKVDNTVTAYVEGKNTPVSVWVRDGSVAGYDSVATVLSAASYPIDFTFYNTSGTTLIQKFIFTKGNIFE